VECVFFYWGVMVDDRACICGVCLRRYLIVMIIVDWDAHFECMGG